MKRLIACILILLLSCQCLVQLGIFTYFQLNRSYIAAVLCINRDKPAKQCQGQCFLKEQLSKTEGSQEQQDLPAPQKQSLEIPAFLLSAFSLQLSLPASPAKVYPLIASAQLPIRLGFSVFHPPKA